MNGQQVHAGITQWPKQTGQFTRLIPNGYFEIVGSSNLVCHKTLLHPPS